MQNHIQDHKNQSPWVVGEQLELFSHLVLSALAGREFELCHTDGRTDYVAFATITAVQVQHLNAGYDVCYVTWHPHRFIPKSMPHSCSVPITDDCALVILERNPNLWNPPLIRHLKIKEA